MKPFARITLDGKDITANLGDRLLSVECHDEAEDKSDRVTIEIDARRRASDGAAVDIPLIGATASVVIGYEGGESADRGSYKLDDIQAGSPPRRITVTGKSADMPSKYRTPRSQSYHQKTLGEIVEDIAKRNGYDAVTDPEIAEIVVRHVDQNKESDMAFATRLAAQYDAVAKPVAGKLVMAKRGSGKAVTGAALPPVSLTEQDCIRWDFSYSARDEAGEAGGLAKGKGKDKAGGTTGDGAEVVDFTSGIDEGGDSEPSIEGKGGVRAHWVDIRTGKREKVEVGREPFHELRDTYHNEAEAKAAASAYRNKSARGKATFGCTIGGRVSVQAEAVLTLVGFDPWVPTSWRIKTAVHRYDGSGYTTRIDAELFDEKAEKVSENVKKTKPSKDDTVDKDASSSPTKGKSTGKTTSDGATIIDFTKGIE